MLEEKGRLINELGRIMFENSNSDEVHTWLECKNFDTVADQILSYLQLNGVLHPQLQQHVVSWRSEQLKCCWCGSATIYKETGLCESCFKKGCSAF